MQDDQDNGESPALDTLEIWNGSSTAESATDEPLAHPLRCITIFRRRFRLIPVLTSSIGR